MAHLPGDRVGPSLCSLIFEPPLLKGRINAQPRTGPAAIQTIECNLQGQYAGKLERLTMLPPGLRCISLRSVLLVISISCSLPSSSTSNSLLSSPQTSPDH